MNAKTVRIKIQSGDKTDWVIGTAPAFPGIVTSTASSEAHARRFDPAAAEALLYEIRKTYPTAELVNE